MAICCCNFFDNFVVCVKKKEKKNVVILEWEEVMRIYVASKSMVLIRVIKGYVNWVCAFLVIVGFVCMLKFFYF